MPIRWELVRLFAVMFAIAFLVSRDVPVSVAVATLAVGAAIFRRWTQR